VTYWRDKAHSDKKIEASVEELMTVLDAVGKRRNPRERAWQFLPAKLLLADIEALTVRCRAMNPLARAVFRSFLVIASEPNKYRRRDFPVAHPLYLGTVVTPLVAALGMDVHASRVVVDEIVMHAMKKLPYSSQWVPDEDISRERPLVRGELMEYILTHKMPDKRRPSGSTKFYLWLNEQDDDAVCIRHMLAERNTMNRDVIRELVEHMHSPLVEGML
jgi:hypothetical protein